MFALNKQAPEFTAIPQTAPWPFATYSCANLVSIDRKGTVGLIHRSLDEYILSRSERWQKNTRFTCSSSFPHHRASNFRVVSISVSLRDKTRSTLLSCHGINYCHLTALGPLPSYIYSLDPSIAPSTHIYPLLYRDTYAHAYMERRCGFGKADYFLITDSAHVAPLHLSVAARTDV